MNRIKYIEILEAEFLYRRSKDIFYSLRNFAQDLEINPMHLSNILKNKRGLSRRKAEVVARKLLHLRYTEKRKFLLLVSATSARSRFERNLAKTGLKNCESSHKLRIR